jgi:hypothetical protein
MIRLLGTTLLAALVSATIMGCPSEDAAVTNATPASAEASVPDGPGACQRAVDCPTGACRDGRCQTVEPPNGTQNDDETDVDCGGSKAPACGDGKKCVVATDCTSAVCTGGVCQAPSPSDGVKNGDETDLDCGGASAPKCAPGKGCGLPADCATGSCGVTKVCLDATAADGVKNGTETDVDCGGGAPTNAARCETGKACNDDGDCSNVRCNAGTKVCNPPTAGDGLKNGSETDVDCGGGAPTNALGCALDGACATHDDCASKACAISGPKAGKCVASKSCVKNEGGYTCGRDDRDFGGATFAHESCCETAPLDGSTAKISRFAITAGRMRAFIERLNGNVRGFVQNPMTKPAGWLAGWDVLVPSDIGEAETMLGPYWNNAPNDPNVTEESAHSKRSCGYGQYNGHTYWVSTNQASQVFSQAQLDVKVLNCVGWHLVRAFCAWDGGRMATVAELNNAYTNGSATTYPWTYAGSAYANPAYVLSTPNQDDRLNHKFNYGFPGGTPATNRITWWLSPPGRFWRGWNKNKVEIAGNVLEWTGDQEYNFAWNSSFENHTGTFNNGGDWRTPGDRSDVPNGYYALGARCVYP